MPAFCGRFINIAIVGIRDMSKPNETMHNGKQVRARYLGVEKFKIHEGYSKHLAYDDIALIKCV
jgi:hypothetical protein